MSKMISDSNWRKFARMLSMIHLKAAAKMKKYIEKKGFSDMKSLIYYANALTDTFGGAAAELSCEMYEAAANAAGKYLPPAEPAEPPDYGEVARTIYGIHKTSENPNEYAGAVGRLVKRTGADTMLKNAKRDEKAGAEFAWIPSGDTCAFCITLASNGWQKMSQTALKGGHAEHIHSNCNCTYAVRFNGEPKYEGYDPEEYKKQYYGAEGDTPQARINYMRRQQYAENPEKYRRKKRINYAIKAGALDAGAYNDNNDPYYEKRDKFAHDFYEEIRNRKRIYEIQAISQNTSFTEQEVDIIFAHIFEKQHLFEDGSVRRFDPSYDMAQSWIRLREGRNIQKHDVIMLHHELEEAVIMNNNLEIPYEKAHNVVEKRWNYRKALDAFLDGIRHR